MKGHHDAERPVYSGITEVEADFVSRAPSRDHRVRNVARVKSVFQRLGQAISEGAQRWYGDAIGGINAVVAKIGAAIKSAFDSLSGVTSDGGHVNTGPAASGPRWHGGIHLNSYVPPSGRGTPAVIKINNVLDGRKVGESVVRHMIRASTHVQSSANFDGLASPVSGDFSYT